MVSDSNKNVCKISVGGKNFENLKIPCIFSRKIFLIKIQESLSLEYCTLVSFVREYKERLLIEQKLVGFLTNNLFLAASKTSNRG